MLFLANIGCFQLNINYSSARRCGHLWMHAFFQAIGSVPGHDLFRALLLELVSVYLVYLELPGTWYALWVGCSERHFHFL